MAYKINQWGIDTILGENKGQLEHLNKQEMMPLVLIDNFYQINCPCKNNFTQKKPFNGISRSLYFNWINTLFWRLNHRFWFKNFQNALKILKNVFWSSITQEQVIYHFYSHFIWLVVFGCRFLQKWKNEMWPNDIKTPYQKNLPRVNRLPNGFKRATCSIIWTDF